MASECLPDSFSQGECEWWSKTPPVSCLSIKAGASVYILTHLATMNTIIPPRIRWNGYQVDTCVWWQHETFAYMPCWLAACLRFWPSRAAHPMVRVLHETWVRLSVKCRALIQKTPTGEWRCPSGATWKLRCRCGEADITSEGPNLDNHTFLFGAQHFEMPC